MLFRRCSASSASFSSLSPRSSTPSHQRNTSNIHHPSSPASQSSFRSQLCHTMHHPLAVSFCCAFSKCLPTTHSPVHSCLRSARSLGRCSNTPRPLTQVDDWQHFRRSLSGSRLSDTSSLHNRLSGADHQPLWRPTAPLTAYHHRPHTSLFTSAHVRW